MRRHEPPDTPDTPDAEPPFVVLADDREHHPYTFAGLGAGACVQTARLAAGDYSTADGSRAVSRKSLIDLYATLGDRRRLSNFGAELGMLSHLTAAAVVVEADWELEPPPRGSGWPRSLICRLVRDLMTRYPRIGWLRADGRRSGEAATLLFLLGDESITRALGTPDPAANDCPGDRGGNRHG